MNLPKYVSTAQKRSPEDRPKRKPIERTILWILLGLLIIVLLKWQVIAGYGVATSSMEPTLLGDSKTGEKVAVFKLGYSLSDPERHDLVVFFKEGTSHLSPGLFERKGGSFYIKRLGGLPGDTIQIKGGDLYFGTAPQSLDRKSLERIQSILIPCYEADFTRDFFKNWKPYAKGGASPFSIEPEGLLCDTASVGNAATAELVFSIDEGAVMDGYLLEDGYRAVGSNAMNDLALHLEFELLQDRGEIYGVLQEGSDVFRFDLRAARAGGGGLVTHHAGQPVVQDIPISAEEFGGLETGRTYSLSFIHVDNQVFLVLDGEVLAEFAYAENTYLFNHSTDNLPIFGAKEAKVRFRDVRIDRDVYYTSDRGSFAVDRPYTVPEGHWFFLGDNSRESEDSRSFGPVPREDFVGEPLMVYYPFRRIRSL